MIRVFLQRFMDIYGTPKFLLPRFEIFCPTVIAETMA